MSVAEDDVLVGPIPLTELGIPSLRRAGVTGGFVTVHRICVGCNTHRTLDVSYLGRVKFKEALSCECIQSPERCSVLLYKVTKSEVMVALQPRDLSLGSGVTQLS